MLRLLILGGSSEASALARALAGRGDVDAVLSLAGRMATAPRFPITTRIGGFGGTGGLVSYLQSRQIDALVDATHPFAAKMSNNAAAACAEAGVRRLIFSRPAWTPGQGDFWRNVDDMSAAAVAIGPAPRNVFLTIGRLSLGVFASAPHHRYLVRTIEPASPDLPNAVYLQERPPFDAASEEALMRREKIDVLVTKNSGGAASLAKLIAARRLGIETIMVRRPPPPEGPRVDDLDAAMAWIEARIHDSSRA